MNIILFVCLVVYIATSLEGSEFKKYRDSFHEITRHERASPPPSKLSKLTTNHMRIARIANGIHLQRGLTDGSIKLIDIVAGMWNLKDRRALEQLSNISIGNLTMKLNDLDEALKKVPDGLKQVDVKDVNQKWKLLDSLKPNIPKIRAAVDFANFPDLATDSADFAFLKDTKVKECLAKTKAASVDVNKTTVKELTNVFVCSTAWESDHYESVESFKTYKNFLKHPAEDRDFKTFTAGFAPVRDYLKNHQAFKDLGAQLSTSSTLLTSFNDLLTKQDSLADIEKILKMFEPFLNELQTPSATNRIAVAFPKAQGLSELLNDLKDKWVWTVLNDGETLLKLKDSLKPLISFSSEFEAMSPSFERLTAKSFPSQMTNLVSTSAAVSSVASKIDALAKLSQCFPAKTVAEPASVKEIEQLGSLLGQLFTPLQELSPAVDKIKLDAETVGHIGQLKVLRTNSKDQPTQEIIDLLKKLDAKMTTYSENLDKAAAIVAKHNIFSQYKALADFGTKTTEVKDWMKATNLMDATKCDFQNAVTSALSELNNLGKSVKDVKTNNVVADVIDMSDEISKINDALVKINKFSTSNLESKDLGLSFVAAQPASTLLDVAVGIHTLHQMSQAHGSKADLQMVIGSEPTVKAAIPKVKDPNSQSSLTTTWGQFPPVSAALTDYSKKLDDLEAALKDAPEKSLADVGKTYKTAATIQFQGVIDLKPFTKSFQLFDAPDQGIKDVEKAFKSIENQVSGDLKLTQASFSKLTTALGDLKKQIDSFFGKGPGAAGQQVQNTTAADEGGVMMTIIIVVGVVLLVLGLIGGVILFICCYFKKHEYKPLKKYRMSKGSGKGPPEPEYKSGPEADDFTYAYCKLQDIRLKINKRDANNCTPLYNAVMNKDWQEVRSLLDQGALVDANCGKNLRTCLHELVLAKDLVHGLWFLKAGAFDSQPSANGDTVFTWSDTNGFHEMFAEFKDTHKNRRIVPQGYPRPWNILVVNPCLLTPYERRKIPLRIRNKITWGFNYNYKKHDLDKYTHIVMPTHYLANTHMVKLDDYDLFPYRCIASLANLVVESWITEMVKNPDVIDKDEEYYIEACNYDEYVGSGDSPYYNSPLLELKTDLHKGHPKLLTNTRITILETKDPKMSKLKSGWEEVIRLFGGTVCKVPEPDKGDNPQLPYQCGYNWYSNQHNTQNACWILRFDDSVINPIWRSDKEGYTLVPFKFLPICIAGNYILNATNDVVPLEYDEQSKSAIDKKSVAKKSAIGGNPNTTTGGATKSTTKSTETKTKTPDTKSKTDKQ